MTINTDNMTSEEKSRLYHISALESMLRKATKFTVSSKTKHDVTIERKKEKGKPYVYIVNVGFNNRVNNKLESIREVYGNKSEEYISTTEFSTLIEAFSIAERYIDSVEQ